MKEKTGREKTSNWLSSEVSPYLLQHAENPVNWHPWGPEALERAREEDKPIFHSIGYSTCHWCHVMAHESFEDPEVAALLNEHFVSIKVDREERPDIDGVYMTACQIMTGGGGWPLTILMTSDGRPFFAGTYIPKTARGGKAGMTELIATMGGLWAAKREELLDIAEEMTGAVRTVSGAAGKGGEGGRPGEAEIVKGYRSLHSRYDAEHGGFGTAPKFPSAHNVLLVLRHWERSGENIALTMMERTLEAMCLGGMYDHVGYGFHRYSTDARWFLPHFEKMLYDQAMLAMAYLEGYQIAEDPLFRRTAQDVLEYVLRDLTSAEWGFYTGEDADSEGEEGKYYVWTEGELNSLLGVDAELFMKAFNTESGGNFRDEASGERAGANILHLTKRREALAREWGMDPEGLRARLEEARVRLFEARRKRVPPLKDDKILTDNNGLMIAAMAIAGRVLEDDNYTDAAERAAQFIRGSLTDGDGRLVHRYRDGAAGIPGMVDDYAFMIWGLLELHETTEDDSHLEWALKLNEQLLEHFWDNDSGGFYQTPDDGEKLLVRRKEIYDGAIPSGNSVAMHNMLRLGKLKRKKALTERAWAIAEAFGEEVRTQPMGHSHLLGGVMLGLKGR